MEKKRPDELENLNISSHEPLEQAERTTCPKCNRKRKYLCYDCELGLVEDIPQVELPVKVQILKCKKEPRSKSSAVPGAVLSPNVEVIDCLPSSVPEFSPGTVLVYPGESATPIWEMSKEALSSIKSAVFIDSTWRQTFAMLNSGSLDKLPMVKLVSHKTLFWRYQDKGKESLATIEAVYHFLVDYHNAMHQQGLFEPYQGTYDDLLWLYTFNYQLIQKEYTERRHKGKRFRHMPDYIKRPN